MVKDEGIDRKEGSVASLIPVGSVVALEGAPVPLVVVGRAMRDGGGRVWDYLAVPYPEGVVDPERSLLFQRSEIREVLFEGCRSERDRALAGAIDAYLAGDERASWPPEAAAPPGGGAAGGSGPVADRGRVGPGLVRRSEGRKA